MIDQSCPDCRQLTGGCARHNAVIQTVSQQPPVDELELLREAHKTHRLTMSLLKQRVESLEQAVGVPFSVGGKSLYDLILELQGHIWSAGEAKQAADRMRRLADAIYDIFHDSDT